MESRFRCFHGTPILLGGVIAPVLWSGLLHSILEAVDPVLNQRIDWVLVCPFPDRIWRRRRIVVSGKCVYRTWQHVPFGVRAGIEAAGASRPKTTEMSIVTHQPILVAVVHGCVAACNGAVVRRAGLNRLGIIPPPKPRFRSYSLLYSQHCAGCHGGERKAWSGDRFGQSRFSCDRDDSVIRRTTATSTGTSMPALRRVRRDAHRKTDRRASEWNPFLGEVRHSDK